MNKEEWIKHMAVADSNNEVHVYPEELFPIMDGYAEQEAIAFWKFCEKNNYHLTIAADEIYKLFKNNT